MMFNNLHLNISVVELSRPIRHCAEGITSPVSPTSSDSHPLMCTGVTAEGQFVE
jgi:hypothetical protein